MRRVGTLVGVISLLMAFSVYGQVRSFGRAAAIFNEPADKGGFANIVAGVDFDGDGELEIYAVNEEVDPVGTDSIPRIYKFEKDAAGRWTTVWWTRLPLSNQNSWPALTSGDWDKDGKSEIIYGPVNSFDQPNQNPGRLFVFETKGDGSDVMGIDNGDGTYRANASWTIVTTPATNLRPFRWVLNDIDQDGTDELIGCLRAGTLRFIVVSVNNIPDTGDSTEVWTLEGSGLGQTFASPSAIWDIAVLGQAIYLFHGNNLGTVTRVVYNAATDSFEVRGAQTGLVPGGSWKSASVVDLDNDGTSEIMIGGWLNASQAKVFLLQKDVATDTLTSKQIADLTAYNGRLYGGAAGDIDGDGFLDFVFGSRKDVFTDPIPNGVIHRLSYLGGDKTDPNNYTSSVIDSLAADQWGRFDVVAIANVDDDANDLEVLYTSGYSDGTSKYGEPFLPPLFVLKQAADLQPIIGFVEDVPNDNGRQVRVNWNAAFNDNADAEFDFITDYTVWRRIDPENGKASSPVPAPQKVQVINGAWWEQVGQTKAIQLPEYALVVPTLKDRAVGQPIAEALSTFIVVAHTDNPIVDRSQASFAVRGFSVDNLIPTAPSGLTATLGIDVNEKAFVKLAWDESPDADFNYFALYRSTQSGFDPSGLTPLVTVTGTAYDDHDIQIAVGESYYYKLVAYDFTGNQGVFSEEVPFMLTGVDDEAVASLPKEYALHQNYPNPFNPTTTIEFALPKDTQFSIKIYNMLGQEIRTLINQETYRAGVHRVMWDGKDNDGRQMASGTYLYTFESVSFRNTKKLTLLK